MASSLIRADLRNGKAESGKTDFARISGGDVYAAPTSEAEKRKAEKRILRGFRGGKVNENAPNPADPKKNLIFFSQPIDRA